MNNLFTFRRLLVLAAVLIAVWLLYPLVFGKREARSPEKVAVRLDAAPNTLNPFLSAGHGPSIYVAEEVFQTLGEFHPKTLEIMPVLVKSIPSPRVIADGPHKGHIAFDFEIMPEAVWDNGSPVTAKDVEFTFKIIFHPGLPTKDFRSFLNTSTGMDIDPSNPRKFTFYFSSYYILAVQTLCGFPIYPAYAYDPGNLLANTSFADLLDTSKTSTLAADERLKAFAQAFADPKYANDPNAISGSGPYRLETMNEQGAVLVKKQNWWGDKLSDTYPMLTAYPKKLVYRVIKDEATLENMMRSGEIDLAGGSISAAKFLEMKADSTLSSKYDFVTVDAGYYARWLLNHRHPIFSDVRVRAALTNVCDYDYFVNQVQRGMAVRIAVSMLANRPYYAKDLPPAEFSIERAKGILSSAGWSDTDGNGILDKVINGKKEQLSFKLIAPTVSKTNELIANSLKETAKQAGIEIIIVSADLATITTDTKSGNYESALIGVSVLPGLVDYHQRFHSKSLAPAGDNRAGYVSARADSLIEAIRVQPDEAKRNALYRQIQQVFYEDIPEIPLYAVAQRLIISKNLEPGLESDNRPGYYEHFARNRK